MKIAFVVIVLGIISWSLFLLGTPALEEHRYKNLYEHLSNDYDEKCFFYGQLQRENKELQQHLKQCRDSLYSNKSQYSGLDALLITIPDSKRASVKWLRIVADTDSTKDTLQAYWFVDPKKFRKELK